MKYKIINKKPDNGCSFDSNICCRKKNEEKIIKIDFLYLDLNICTRCGGTNNNLDDAIKDVSAVLQAAGYKIIVNKIHIKTKDLAEKHEFVSSPTIRVNDKDIAIEVKENCCESCGDLCGDDVACRIWSYEGKDYIVPPKALIINSILKEVYSEKKLEYKKTEYKLPENLKNFFEAMEKKKQ